MLLNDVKNLIKACYCLFQTELTCHSLRVKHGPCRVLNIVLFLLLLFNSKEISAQIIDKNIPIIHSEIKCDTVYCSQIITYNKINLLIMRNNLKYIYKKQIKDKVEWFDNNNKKVQIFMYYTNYSWEQIQDAF